MQLPRIDDAGHRLREGEVDQWTECAVAMVEEFLSRQRGGAAELDLHIDRLRAVISAGGKRIRPRLCVLGWMAYQRSEPSELLLRVAASLELFHAFALIHDDVMDQSSTRRGNPTAHNAFARCAPSSVRDKAAFGANAAILLGDLTLGWSYEILVCGAAAASTHQIPWDLLNAMRTETMVGQYLDLMEAGNSLHVESSRLEKIIELKTAKYTFERPLHIGAHMAGASDDQCAALSKFALPLGRAFQHVDDLIGVFGDPAVTGKSNEEDILEGKSTLLLSETMSRVDGTDRAAIERASDRTHPSTREDIECVRRIIVRSGSLQAVHDRIVRLCATASDELNGLLAPPEVTSELADIIGKVRSYEHLLLPMVGSGGYLR